MEASKIQIVTLHGALLDRSSMTPIAKALQFAFSSASRIDLELPGHGARINEEYSTFHLEELASDIGQQVDQRHPDFDWRNTIAVGESAGALVLTKLIQSRKITPYALLLGEPPLGNAESMRYVARELEDDGSRVAMSLWGDLFAFQAPGTLNHGDLLSSLGCCTLLVHGTELETTESVRSPSVVEVEHLVGAYKNKHVHICAAEGRGHRVLQSMAICWAFMLKGILAGGGIPQQKQSILKESI